MSDEEKEAIEILKDRVADFDELYSTYRQSFIKPYDKSITIILKLVEKQQKEIEKLKEENELYEKTKQLFENDLLGYIKGYEDGRNGSTGLAYKVGKEFADYTLSLQLNRYKESYLEVRKELDNAISKDKIKAKIEEVQNMKAKAKDIVFKSSLNYIETELQSLLEKE